MIRAFVSTLLLGCTVASMAQLSRVYQQPFAVGSAQGYDMHLLNEDTIWISGALWKCPECNYQQRMFTGIYSGDLNPHEENSWNLTGDDDYNYYMCNPVTSHTVVNSEGFVAGIDIKFRGTELEDSTWAILKHFNRSAQFMSQDTLWEFSRNEGQKDAYAFSGGILASDGNYVFTGLFRPYPQQFQQFAYIFLTKITPDGEVLWIKSYPNTYQGWRIKEANDGGFYVCGWQWGPLAQGCIGNQIYDDELVLLKTDSEGIETKRLVFGTPYGEYALDVIEEEDRLVLLGTIASGTDGQLCTYQNFFSLVVTETETGFEMGELKKYLENNPTHNFFGSFKLNNEYYIYGYTRHLPTPYQKGILIKLNSDLDLEWKRLWYHYSNTDSQHTVTRLIPLSEGGFLGAGYTMQDIQDPIPLLNEVWLIKLDQDGCLVPGCAVGVDNFLLGLDDAIQLFPNPAENYSLVKLILPENYPNALQKNHRLVITDQSGKIVKEITLPNLQPGQSHLQNLDLSGISAGIYHIHWAENQTWLGAKQLIVR